MITIKKISAPETFEVRHPVLRKGKPVESCAFDGDDLATTTHYGLFENDSLLGIISVFENANPLFHEMPQAQLRGMAILEEHQKRGFGKLLVAHCEQELASKNTALIWFNARENAVGFYERIGYDRYGDMFEIPGIGPHYIMFKKTGN